MPNNDGITQPVYIPGSSQFPLRALGSTNRTTALSTVAGTLLVLTAAPSTAAASGMFVDRPRNGYQYQMCFHGDGSDDDWFEGRVWGYKELQKPDSADSEYVPRLLAVFKGQLRATAISAGAFLDGRRPADSLTIVNDYTPGATAQISTNPADGTATLTLDAVGHEFIVVELTNRVPSGETGSASTAIGVLGCAL